MTVEELVRAIARYCGEHGFPYPMAQPYPEWDVNVVGLFDHLHEQTNIPKETIGEWFEEGKDDS